MVSLSCAVPLMLPVIPVVPGAMLIFSVVPVIVTYCIFFSAIVTVPHPFSLVFEGPVQSGFFPSWGQTGTVTGSVQFKIYIHKTGLNPTQPIHCGSIQFNNRLGLV